MLMTTVGIDAGRDSRNNLSAVTHKYYVILYPVYQNIIRLITVIISLVILCRLTIC